MACVVEAAVASRAREAPNAQLDLLLVPTEGTRPEQLRASLREASVDYTDGGVVADEFLAVGIRGRELERVAALVCVEAIQSNGLEPQLPEA